MRPELLSVSCARNPSEKAPGWLVRRTATCLEQGDTYHTMPVNPSKSSNLEPETGESGISLGCAV